METIATTTINIWTQTEKLLTPVLQNLDPSLFQNVILGILALLVPIGVGILSFFFEERSKGKIQSNLELYILLRQVLKAKQIVFFSLIALLLLAIYELSFINKVIALSFFTVYVIWLIGVPLKNIWKWFFENITDFSIKFLKGLSVRKDAGTLITSWQALWLGDAKGRNEREFTKIFISHIDEAIKYKKYHLAIELSQVYQNNIEKRDRFSLGYEMLPKLFEWHEKFWEIEQRWLTKEILKEKIQNSFSEKHFPTFRKWVFKFLSKSYSEPDYFWNWHYFQQELFPAVAKALLHDGHGSYQLFTTFKKYVDESVTKLETIEDKDRKKRWDNYIVGLFGSFCPMFFDTIDKVSGNYDIWHHNFPPEWKVTAANSKSGIPRIILHEFLEWAQKRIFKQNPENYDKDLSEVANGIFPNAHHSLFPAFINLLFTSEIKDAVQKEPNFFLINTGISWSGEKSDEDVQKMFNQQDQSQKEETAKIIFEYFRDNWRPLLYFKEDLTEKELAEWEGYAEDQRKVIINRVRKTKLQKILDELNSKEVTDLCKESERREHQRKIFIELIQLLLANII